jgi:predicted ATPase
VLVVLNEPESSLHADLLPALADLIGSAAENTQVVVTTHSNALADALLDHHDRAGVRLELVAGRTTVQPL